MPLDPNLIAQRSASELKERARRQMKSRLGRADDGVYVSPNFGDGGAHTQPGALRFNPRDIQPFGDHILVVVDGDEIPDKDFEAHLFGCSIVKPDIARNRERDSRTGTVLKVGPGAWKDSKTHKDRDMFKRIPMTLKPGDRVIIGSFSDWESWDADYEGRGANIVLCQEADVRLYGRSN